MIYIIKEYDSLTEAHYIVTVIDTDVDIVDEYKKFIHKEAKKRNIIIHDYWYNMMNRENYHENLSDSKYRKKEAEWIKFLQKNTLLSFVKNKLKLSTSEFKQVSNSYY